MTTEGSTSAVAPTTDAADEAGGEAIFSSDGLAPLPVPPPPIIQKQNAGNDSELLDSATVDPMQAFEVFQGRLFAPNSNYSASAGRSSVGTSLAAADKEKKNNAVSESTLMKLARIQQELNDMQQTTDQHGSGSGGDANNNDTSYTDATQELIQKLSNQVSTMQTQRTSRQQNINALLQQEVHKLLNAPSSDTTMENTPNANVDNISSMTQVQEARLNRIESFMGSALHSASTTPGSTPSIMERLAQAEDKLKTVDEDTLNNAAARAKVIRADLEAAAKAQAKLSNSTSSSKSSSLLSSSANSTQHAQDTKTISKLHNALLDLDGFLLSSPSSSQNTLPILVQRLQSCATLHSKAADFHNTLTQLEGTVQDVQGLMTSVEGQLKDLEVGMAKNMEVMKGNMDHLEETFRKNKDSS